MNIKPSPLPNKEVELVISLYSKGEYSKAVNSIKKLNNIYPNQPLLFNLIGACYKELEELEGAAKMFEIALNLSPNYAEAHYNLGVVLKELDQESQAIECYRKAISINPNYPDAHNNLGTSLHSLGQLEEAIESLEWAIAYKHDFYEAHNNLGNVFNDFGKVNEAVKCYEKAVELNPNYAKAFFNLAIAYKDLGNLNAYQKCIKKTVVLEPDWGDAHLHLSRIKNYKINDTHILEMLSILKKSDLSLIDRIGFNFALAHAYENLEDHSKQFKFLNEANRLRKKESQYSFDKDQIRFQRIKTLFQKPPQSLSKTVIEKSNFRPIFIVGMPRSGTSLVHQIIDSHKTVFGAGELTTLSPIINQFFKSFDNKIGITESDLLSIRRKYSDFITRLDVTQNIVVDKMPLNFRHIGFILSAFPEAKIIHMNRDPMATCWSIYKYYFNGNYYSYSQEDLANYFLLYKDLMAFWHKTFPNKIYDLCYEDLTTAQESETRKLINYCNLEWDENCLKFNENKGAVKTTSALQVRKKMYQGSSEVWRKYESFLKPLIKGLNYK